MNIYKVFLQCLLFKCVLKYKGFALGSVEGRVCIQYVNPTNPKDNFTFKCHRSNGVQNLQVMYLHF